MILGPFHLDATLIPHTGDTTTIGTVPAGTCIIGGFWRVTEDIGELTEAAFYITFLAAAPDPAANLTNLNMDTPATIDTGSNLLLPSAASLANPPFITKASLPITVQYDDGGSGLDPVTQGAADLWLLTAPYTL